MSEKREVGNMAKVKCSECGRLVENPHYINGKPYGYSCYKQKLALIYKQWEDEKNAEYSAKCFAAMQIFQGKKSNSFHDSICKQWNDCKKLTAKQLNCITKGFNFNETISFYKVWFLLANEENKKTIACWAETLINKERKFADFVNDEEVHNILLADIRYKRHGFHFWYDIEEEPEDVFISCNEKNNRFLNENLEDEYIEVLKVIKREAKRSK